MPRIPQYTARYSRPSGTGMVPVSNVPDPLSGVGETIMDIAGMVSKDIEQRKERRRVVEFGELASNFERELADDYIKYTSLQGKDAYGSQERLADLEKKALEKYKTNDPMVNERLAMYIRDNITGKKLAYNAHESQEEEVEMRLTDARVLDTFKENAAHGSGTLQENTEKYTAFVTTLVSNNSISEEEGTDKILHGTRDITRKTLEGMIVRNPSSVIEQIRSGIWDDKLSSDDLKQFSEDARREADRQQKIRDANKLLAQKEAEEQAIKTLQDASSTGKLTRDLVVKYKNTLSAAEYKKWNRLYDAHIDSLSKDIKEDAQLETEARLGAIAITGEGINTAKDLKSFQRKVGEAVALRQLSATKARQILQDAEEALKGGNADLSRSVSQAIASIKSAHKLGFYGDGKSKESKVIADKTIFNLLEQVRKDPGLDVGEYVATILTPPEMTEENKGGWLSRLFSKTRILSEEESRAKLLEMAAKRDEKVVLPSRSALSSVVIIRGFTQKRELIDYVATEYGMTTSDAVKYIEELR